ncbi:unnamed protein product [Camellia sinensis]
MLHRNSKPIYTSFRVGVRHLYYIITKVHYYSSIDADSRGKYPPPPLSLPNPTPLLHRNSKPIFTSFRVGVRHLYYIIMKVHYYSSIDADSRGKLYAGSVSYRFKTCVFRPQTVSLVSTVAKL